MCLSFFFYLVQKNCIKFGPYNTLAQKYLGWGITTTKLKVLSFLYIKN